MRSWDQWGSVGQATPDPISSPSPAMSIPTVGVSPPVTVPPEGEMKGMPRRTRSGREVRMLAYLRDYKLD